jgi:alkylresorcinol/alkylpyrone synthase/polyketide synthase Type III
MKRTLGELEQWPAFLSLATANPRHRYSQQEIYDLACSHSEFYRNPRVRQIFMNSDIEFRHLYFDMAKFGGVESTDEMHERFQRGAVDIGKQAIEACLSGGDIKAGEIDSLVVATCTGYLCPGLSSILIKETGMRRDVQRADLVGMGCAGAMPALQCAYNFVRSHPSMKSLVVAVEICSACYYLDESVETIVGNAICADGAAAAIIGMSDDRDLLRIVGFGTHLEPSYIESVGFEQRDGKLRIILSKDLRGVAGGLVSALVDRLASEFGLSREDIAHWVIHSGGRKVIDSIQREIGLTSDQIRHSRTVLSNFGNMSSPTVLFVLNELLRTPDSGREPKPDDLGMMLALGPGLAVEGALLRW